VAGRRLLGERLLPQGVELDVVGGRMQQQRIILELAEASVAVEAQQRSICTGLVVVIDVLRRGCAADGAEATLFLEHGVGFLGADPVAARQVIRAATAPLGDASLSPLVVARQAVAGDAGG
jgi:hypothetical protein